MLNAEELNDIEEICERWLFKKENNLFDLEAVYKGLVEIDFNPVIKAFTDRLDQIECKFSKSEQVSGSICFFGGVVTSLLHYGYIEEIEGLFTFALCYMLIDHYLDDNTISYEEKKVSMQDIYLFIYTGKRNSENPLINAAADRYVDLIERVPKSKEMIKKLFESELNGVKIQGKENLSREVYLKIAEEKGGLTAATIGSIIGLKEKEENESMRLGAMIQMVDDLIDIQDDEDLNIMTLARYDLQHTNLDRYVYDSMIKIRNLSTTYNFFKPILLYGLILGVHDNPNSTSKNLKDLLDKYDTFSQNTSKETLVQWFHNKLYSYISNHQKI